MAGSWKHIIDNRTGHLVSTERFPEMIENLGDAYEAIEECYGMVMYLTGGDRAKIEEARQHYEDGLAIQPHGERGDGP